MANNERVVDLVVRAKDQYSKVLANLKQQQQQIAESSRKSQLQFLTSTRKELADTQAQIKKVSQQRDNYRPVAGADRSKVAADILAQVQAQKQLIEKAQQLKASLTGVEAATHRLRAGQASSFGEFVRNTTAMQSEAASAKVAATALNKVEVATKGVAAAQSKAVAVSNKRNLGNNAGKKGEAQSVEMYGLKPYQMVNLGYQLNDVISGLAMGQAPLQILSQQAGQFAQIWPNMMVRLVRSIPQLVLLTAVFSPFIAAMIRVKQESESLSYFSRNLALMADGGRLSAEGLAATTREVTRLGVSVEEARKTVLSFAQARIPTGNILPIAQMAKDLSSLTGADFGDTAARLGKVFQGSVKDVRDLDKELKFLTASQLEQIYAMERAGDKAGALKVAQDALKTALVSSRAEATPWGQAVDDLSSAWDRLVTALENSGVITLASKALDLLALSAKGTAIVIDEVGKAFTTDNSLAAQYVKLKRQREELRKLVAQQRQSDEAMFGPNAKNSSATDSLELQLADVEKQYQAIVAEINKVPEATKEVVTQSEEQKKLAVDTSQFLSEQLKTLNDEAVSINQTNRERFIEAELLKARNAALERAKELGQDFNGLTAEQNRMLREQAGMTFDRKENANVTTSGLNGVIDRIIGIESGGNAAAKNPASSATGLGQFIESTWLNLFRKYFPEEAASMGKEAILELRKDSTVSRQMVEIYARENAKVLQGAGIAVNDAAIYLAHFLGPRGAASILAAKAGTPVSDILGQDQINANASILEGKNASEVVAWAQKKMGITENELAVTTRLSELDAERLKTSKEYQEEYRKRIDSQQFEISLASKTARDAAIAKALKEEELTAQKAGLKLTKEQRIEIERTTGALFDRENVETKVNELLEKRSLLMDSLELAQKAGDTGKVATIVGEIQGTEESLKTAVDQAIAFWQAIGGPGADAAILKLQNIKGAVGDVVKEMETQFLPTAIDLNEKLAEVGSNAFSAMAEAIANGENVAQAFFQTLLQGIGEFIIEIGKAIVKQALFNAISGGMGAAGSGGAGGFLSGLLGKLFHSGGVLGRSGGSGSRMVNPMVFAGAQRFHTGGVLGLGPNEMPVIGLKDEEMLTRDDPRHVMNGGKAGSSVSLKSVNVFNPVDILEAALATEPGQKVIFNWMTRNARSVNGALQV